MLIKNFNLREDRKLLEEQEDAIKFMLSRTESIVSLQTGLGKTYSSITAMQLLKNTLKQKLLTIIIAPVNAIISFERELMEFGYSSECVKEYNEEGEITLESKIIKDGLSTKIGYLVSGNYDVLFNDTQCDDIVITSYTKVGDYLEDLEEIIIKHRTNHPDGKVLLIADEVHTLSNKNTTRTKIALELRKMCDIVWGLTATPLKNDYVGLYHLCNFIRPKYIAKSFAEFTREYCVTERVQIRARGGRTVWVPEIVGRKNEEGLKEKLDELIIYRELNYNLKYHYIPVNLNEDELDMYDEVASARLTGGREQFSNRVIDLQKLLDNSLSIEILDEDDVPVFTKNYKFTSKEDRLFSVLDTLIKKEQTPIIYTDFVDTLDRLYEILTSKGYTVHKIDGRTNQKKRKFVEENLKVGDITLITSAGTASLNLQKANVMIFYNVPFSSVNVIQSIGRITRLGSSYSKQHVIFIYCEGTIDTYKIAYFKSNASLISTLIGESSNLPKDLEEKDSEELRNLRQDLLWKYKSKKNGVRRMRRGSIRDRLIVTDETQEEFCGPVLNLSGKTLELIINGKPVTSKSSLEDFNPMITENIGYTKARIREYLRDDYSKIRKIYFILTREAKSVFIIDSERRIGKLIKDYLYENWRYFEDKL